MYWKRPTESDLAGTGKVPADFDDDEPKVEVWPENWDAIRIFGAVQNQWRMSFNGPYALDYSVVYQEIDRRGLRDRHEELMEQMAVIEVAALGEIAKKR